MFDAIESVRKNWGWFLASGIALIIIGLLAIGSSVYTTLFTMSFLGALLAIAGFIGVVYAFWARKWGGFFGQLIMGLLYLLTGALILWNPAAAAVALTLLMAVLFIISGIAKIVGSVTMRFHQWGWVLVSGLISLLLRRTHPGRVALFRTLDHRSFRGHRLDILRMGRYSSGLCFQKNSQSGIERISP